MPKTKTHSGASKRFSVTSSGTLMRKGVGKKHNLSNRKKTKKQKRNLGYKVPLHPGDAAKMKKIIAY